MTRSFVYIAMAALPIAALTVGLAAPTLGQPYAPGYQPYQPAPYYRSYSREHERERERERRHREEVEAIRAECKGEQVIATGGTRPTSTWARRAANATWSRLVTASYGQEWSDFNVAREYRYDCFPGVLGGRACKVAAFPCRARAEFERTR
jgi:hypothetical protein